MAGSRGPKPFRQAQISTTFLRVPSIDWAAVKRGQKTEFRSGGKVPALFRVKCPTPVVAYRVSPAGHDHALMVLEEVRREKLIEMEPGSLQREGFNTFDEFRRYWMRRERRRFQPMAEVSVYLVRPWSEDDRSNFETEFFDRLYGDFL